MSYACNGKLLENHMQRRIATKKYNAAQQKRAKSYSQHNNNAAVLHVLYAPRPTRTCVAAFTNRWLVTSNRRCGCNNCPLPMFCDYSCYCCCVVLRGWHCRCVRNWIIHAIVRQSIEIEINARAGDDQRNRWTVIAQLQRCCCCRVARMRVIVVVVFIIVTAVATIAALTCARWQ